MNRLASIALALMVMTSGAQASDVETIAHLEEQASEAYDGGDITSALSLWLKAAKRGAVDSIVIVAGLYETGEADVIDLDQARYWYELGAEKGDPLAMIRLSELLVSGAHTPTDAERATAAEWLRKAAGLGHPLAQQLVTDQALTGGSQVKQASGQIRTN